MIDIEVIKTNATMIDPLIAVAPIKVMTTTGTRKDETTTESHDHESR
jgi:hypothetical protein